METDDNKFDVIIIGGSYAGLSAAMGLGRALRDVLVIDSGKPCNRQTPYSHNFLTRDGSTPAEINQLAKRDLEIYKTVSFYDGLAIKGEKTENGFTITTEAGDTFIAKKLVFTTGIKDIMPEIDGFSECWGISIVHCPYCHGYEVRNTKTGIFGNGEYGFEFSKLISNWTNDLTLYTNGKSELTSGQAQKLSHHKIKITEKEIVGFNHTNGQLNYIAFKDGTTASLDALYAKIPFVQNSDLPQTLGCAFNEMGYISVDPFQKTSAHGIYACGDNTSFMRSISNAVAMGTTTAAMLNKELIDEKF